MLDLQIDEQGHALTTQHQPSWPLLPLAELYWLRLAVAWMEPYPRRDFEDHLYPEG